MIITIFQHNERMWKASTVYVGRLCTWYGGRNTMFYVRTRYYTVWRSPRITYFGGL